MAESPEAQISYLRAILEGMEKAQKERHEDNKAAMADNRLVLDRIFTQATATNGRLIDMEKWRAKAEERDHSMNKTIIALSEDVSALKATGQKSAGERGILIAIWTAFITIAAALLNWAFRRMWP